MNDKWIHGRVHRGKFHVDMTENLSEDNPLQMDKSDFDLEQWRDSVAKAAYEEEWLPLTMTEKVTDEHDEMIYRLACEYMAKTELYDRSLTDMRSQHDPTEAWLVLDYERRRSNAYALSLRIELSKKYCITPFDLMGEINRHKSYSAQMWIDEYRRLNKE